MYAAQGMPWSLLLHFGFSHAIKSHFSLFMIGSVKESMRNPLCVTQKQRSTSLSKLQAVRTPPPSWHMLLVTSRLTAVSGAFFFPPPPHSWPWEENFWHRKAHKKQASVLPSSHKYTHAIVSGRADFLISVVELLMPHPGAVSVSS